VCLIVIMGVFGCVLSVLHCDYECVWMSFSVLHCDYECVWVCFGCEYGCVLGVF